jgi:hypothetical protein
VPKNLTAADDLHKAEFVWGFGSNDECDHQSLDQSKLSLGPTICKIHRDHSIFHLLGGGWFRSRGDCWPVRCGRDPARSVQKYILILLVKNESVQ